MWLVRPLLGALRLGYAGDAAYRMVYGGKAELGLPAAACHSRRRPPLPPTPLPTDFLRCAARGRVGGGQS
jgi:hypothetical protein